MSLSPENAARSGRYENGWIAINRLIRQGGTWSGHERNVLYWNHGDGTFSDVSAVAGLDFPEDGRAFAAFDFDQDGDLDLVLKNRNSPQLRLLRNDLPAYHHSVAFHLQGTKCNRDAVGARLVLETGSGRQRVKTVRSGSGFLSQPTRTVYFGLGDETKIRSLTVYWPGGYAQKFEAPPADHLIGLTEGETDFRSIPFRPRSRQPKDQHPAPDTRHPIPGTRNVEPKTQSPTADSHPPAPASGIWLTEPVPAPHFQLKTLDGAVAALENYRGHPLILNFWATWCAPCQAELANLQKHRNEIAARGLIPLLISVDEPGMETKISEFAHSKGLTFPVLLANEDTVRQYSVLLQHLTDQASDLVIPTTFLVSSDGEILKFYVGRTSAEQLLEDASLPSGEKNIRSDLLRLALPFRGRVYVTDFRRDWVQLADALALEGFSRQAIAYLHHAIKTGPVSADIFDHLGLLYARQGQWQDALSNFQRAVEFDPSQASPHIHIATAFSQLGRLSEAESAARRALTAAPQDAEALRVWAAVKARQGTPDAALPALLQSLKLDPENADGWYNLALLYQKLGRSLDSRAAFERAIAVNPNHAEALNTLGVLSAEGESLQQAIDFFKRALKARPDFAEAHRNVGLAYARQSNWKEAEDSFRVALRLQPNYAEALNDLGGVYLKTGKLREALALFQQARNQNPDLAQAYLNAARVYMALGENQNAIAALEALLKIYPQEPTATEWIRRLRTQRR